MTRTRSRVCSTAGTSTSPNRTSGGQGRRQAKFGGMSRLVPRMTTFVPPAAGPEEGVIDVITGGGVVWAARERDQTKRSDGSRIIRNFMRVTSMGEFNWAQLPPVRGEFHKRASARDGAQASSPAAPRNARNQPRQSRESKRNRAFEKDAGAGRRPATGS